MADQGFQGTVLTFGTATQDNLRSVTFSDDAGEVDVTGSSDTARVSVGGPRGVACNVIVVGGSALVVGTTGAISAAWNDGKTDGSVASVYRLASREVTGSVGSEILTTLTFRPFSAT